MKCVYYSLAGRDKGIHWSSRHPIERWIQFVWVCIFSMAFQPVIWQSGPTREQWANDVHLEKSIWFPTTQSLIIIIESSSSRKPTAIHGTRSRVERPSIYDERRRFLLPSKKGKMFHLKIFKSQRRLFSFFIKKFPFLLSAMKKTNVFRTCRCLLDDAHCTLVSIWFLCRWITMLRMSRRTNDGQISNDDSFKDVGDGLFPTTCSIANGLFHSRPVERDVRTMALAKFWHPHLFFTHTFHTVTQNIRRLFYIPWSLFKFWLEFLERVHDFFRLFFDRYLYQCLVPPPSKSNKYLQFPSWKTILLMESDRRV